MFQNSCTRFIVNLRKFDHISAAFNSLKFLNMENTRNLKALSLMHKIVRKEAPHYLIDKITFNDQVHEHRTRNRGNIHLPNFRTNYGRNCFFNKIGNLYNQITNQLGINSNLSINSFKIKVKKYFLELQSQ